MYVHVYLVQWNLSTFTKWISIQYFLTREGRIGKSYLNINSIGHNIHTMYSTMYVFTYNSQVLLSLLFPSIV